MKAHADTNPKHFGTYRQAFDTHVQEDEMHSSVIVCALVITQCTQCASLDCCPALQRPMQRVTNLRSSLSRIPVRTYQALEQSLTSSAHPRRSWRSHVRNGGWSPPNSEKVSGIQVHTMSLSAMAMALPMLLGYDIAWSTVAYVALALLLVVAVGWSVRRLMQRNERLEQLVEQRTAHIRLQARQLARYNAELIRSNKMLQETMDEKSKVLGVAAHDLKNSVFGIRALTEIMLEEDPATEGMARRLSLVHNSAEEAMELISNLLSSAASSVHGQLDKHVVDAGAMTEVIAHSFAEQAKRKGQTITCTMSASDIFVEGDEDRLREAINNLVSNAVKYAPLDSRIRLNVTATESDVYIAVSDEGPGLSDHEQKGLFTPFKRLSPEPTGNEGSSGLGLYIVKQIVERHDGAIKVNSTKGEGSTFTLILPRVEPDNDQMSMNNADKNASDKNGQSSAIKGSTAVTMAGELHQ